MPVRSEPAIPQVLIADDQPDVLEALRLLLKGEGYKIESAGSPAAILESVDSAEFDAVLMDLNYARDTTSGQEGLDLLSQLRSHDPTLPIVVMTAWGSVEVAVEAMRRGARDFVQKPWENARLLDDRAHAGGTGARASPPAEARSREPIAQAGRAADAHRRGRVDAAGARVDRARRTVGGQRPRHGRERHRQGHGRPGASRRIGPRRQRARHRQRRSGLSEGVFESELFGHVKGAFTDAKTDRVGRFELADGGTLFLDEIANVPLNLQPKLLRVLETGDFERVGSSRTRQVNVRIVSATNSNLGDEVAGGALPAGPALPAEHDRDSTAAASRAARGHSGAGRALPAAACAALSQEHQWIRAGGAPGAARSSVARKHPRAGSRCRARCADGAGIEHPSGRARTAHRSRRDLADRGHEPRGRRRVPDQESHVTVRRQRQPGGQGARSEPQRTVQTASKIRVVKPHVI